MDATLGGDADEEMGEAAALATNRFACKCVR